MNKFVNVHTTMCFIKFLISYIVILGVKTQVFHDVAYRAHTRADLLDGVDEFLDQVTVLPPGEWDPNIRIEPPSVIPSQVSDFRQILAKHIFHL